MKMDNHKFEYFIDRADKRFDQLDVKIDKLSSSFLEFKFRIIGSVIAISAVVSLVVGLADLYFNKH